MNFLRDKVYLKGLGLTGLIWLAAIVITLPASAYNQPASSNLTSDGLEGFSKAEAMPDGSRFNWSSEPVARLIYPRMPRYTSLTYRLNFNLQRPTGAPPAQIEVYENTADPTGPPRLLTRLVADPADPKSNAPQEISLTVPERPAGKGLVIEFRSNTFTYGKDPRPLGFMFLGATVSVPRSHIFRLFWPYPFWPVAFGLLLIVVWWASRLGLDWLETGLLATMLALVLATSVSSFYQYSWWLGLPVLGLGGLLWLFQSGSRRERSGWLIAAASGLLVIFFLFTSDENQADLGFYLNWSNDVHLNGVWNIYNFDPRLDYTPLIVYLLWFYNLIVWPLGLQTNPLAWRVLVSIMELGLLALLYQIVRLTVPSKAADPQQKTRWLGLLGFNAAFFYSTTIWGQIDIMPLLCQVGALYFIYRRRGLVGGGLLGIVAISKVQGWFVLPLLVWWLVQRCGWRKGLAGLVLGVGLAVGLAGIAFGFDLRAFNHWLNSPELAGTYDNQFPSAFNLNFLVLGLSKGAPPLWLSLLGFGIVGLGLAAVIWFSRGRQKPFAQYELGATLLVVTCFSWLIKMKERYLLYSLPFFSLAVARERRLVKPFLALSLLQTLHLVIELLNASRWKKATLADYPFWWGTFFSQELVQKGLSVLTLALWAYLVWRYIQLIRTPPAQEVTEIKAGESQTV